MKVQITELNIEVEDVDDFNSQATDLMEDYCVALEKQPGMTRQPRDDEYMSDYWAFIWTDKASRLIHEELTNLMNIGRKYFAENELDIQLTMYSEE